MLTFRADVFSWIPQPDVWNPIYVPSGGALLGPGACGPRFGGDNFVTPPSSYAGWNGLTYRAKQTLAFKVSEFGDKDVVTIDNTRVVPGLTTVLTAPRSAGGKVCTSLTPTVTKSTADATWSDSDQWYELRMEGAAHDPIPAQALKHAAGSAGFAVGSAVTPDLEWNITLRIQMEREIKSSLTRLHYGIVGLSNFDESGTLSTPQNFGGSANLIHGFVTVRQFPSYVIYVTVGGNSRRSTSIPVYFSDASKRNLFLILLSQVDIIRQITW
jgi:hypothetical protein